jgi:restriction system protein
VADGAEHDVREVRELLAYDNRIGWAKTYLDKAGLIATVRRGVYHITDLGKAVLARKPPEITRTYLLQFTDFLNLRHDDGAREQAVSPAPSSDAAATPEEQLEGAYRKIRQKVEADLLDAVKAASPDFEKLVIELLVKMGYGGTIADAGEALGRSGDGGIDGVIKEDKLGLDAIYVQAKRWEKNVGRPEVQGFAGSLLGRRGRKGVFLTRAMFSKEARECVGQIDAKIILIDGPTLASLMVDSDVGVNTVETFQLKRVDSDYFSEEQAGGPARPSTDKTLR